MIETKELKSKTYHIIKQKSLNKFKVINRIRIECIGGESMSEKKELIFLSPSDIPILNRRRSGRDWGAIFDEIPVGKLLDMTEGYGSIASVRDAVSKYNTVKNDKVLKAIGRKDDKGKQNIFVQRLKK